MHAGNIYLWIRASEKKTQQHNAAKWLIRRRIIPCAPRGMLPAVVGGGSLGGASRRGCQQDEPSNGPVECLEGASRISGILLGKVFSITHLMIRRDTMPIILWLLGVPITVIIILLLLGVL